MSNRANRHTQHPSNHETSSRSQPSLLTCVIIAASAIAAITLLYFLVTNLIHDKFIQPASSHTFSSSSVITDTYTPTMPDHIAAIIPEEYELTSQYCLSTLILGPDSAVLSYHVNFEDFDTLCETASRDNSCILSFTGREFGDFGYFFITANQATTFIDQALAKPNCTGFNLIKTFTSDELPAAIRQDQQDLTPGHYLVRSYIDEDIAHYILSASSSPQTEVFGYPIVIDDTKLGLIEIPLTALTASLDIFAQGKQQSITYETPFDLNEPNSSTAPSLL